MTLFLKYYGKIPYYLIRILVLKVVLSLRLSARFNLSEILFLVPFVLFYKYTLGALESLSATINLFID